MRIELTNIGIIKKADIMLNGLTVIAGENNSGKSTVGKTLYAILKSLANTNKHIGTGREDVTAEKGKITFDKYIKSIFKMQISEKGTIVFEEKENRLFINIEKDKCKEFTYPEGYKAERMSKYRGILIETPFIWSIFATIKAIKNLDRSGELIDFELSPIIKDLHFFLSQKIKADNSEIKLDIDRIIKGEFTEDSVAGYAFYDGEKNIELINTAMGIKYFGLLQVLSKNNHFYKDQILILDEPEVHLHPNWQLELAKIIVYLVEKGVRVLVNSHSPYMIEALQRYAQKQKIKNNFYLAENGYIIEDKQSLSKTFSKLSEPFDEFDKMDREQLHG